MRKSLLLASAGLLVAAGPAMSQTSARGNEVSEVVVTAAPYALSLDSVTTSVDVLTRDDLDTATAGGLGEALSDLPGVRSSFFGPGASRPVIRGLAGPRVLVLTNGVGMVDASALSPDHQVAVDPQEARRIEVLRGPAALAYGGSAIGGVVNVIDDRISETPVEGIEGRVMGAISSVDTGEMASGALKAGVGPWVFSLDALRRQTEDYDVPVPAESRRQLAADGEEFLGRQASTVENTAVTLESYGAGLSYVGQRGFLGLSVKQTDSRYGVPGHAHEDDHDDHDDDHDDDGHDDDHDGHEEEGVRIELKQTRYDLRGGLDLALGPFERLRVSGGYADYEHVEIEDGAPATRFLSEGWEGRLELVQAERDGWQGAVGLQALTRDFDAQGEEAYVPAVEINEAGVFTLQRLDRDTWGLEGGLRFDRRTLETAAQKAEFDNVSASLGAFMRPAQGWYAGVSLSRTARAPTEAELFADGAHIATRAYEVGNANLDSEISYALDATLHYDGGPWDADLHAFAVRYEGFIDLRPTGAEDPESDLAIFTYRQTDAEFWGGEVEVAYRLWQDGARSFTLEGAADYVRGDTDLGAPARIPPWSAAGRAIFATSWWTGKLELRQVGEQTRVTEGELPTDGYRLLNASVVVRPTDGFKIFLEGRNLNDAEAREHASFLKDLAPLPGRSFRLGVGYTF
ncbi:TonB-dependent receptor [Phenylobacterium sp.]|uniref:TonB-dependent receptor n=1 Tax=Phenylobacterium sp. TaxID=1871053 RepID=UPI00272F6F6C|nr:TonB-dependent receptor [Phenylobacterium sp.]MDP1875434.1 TonB-dependent receptor [Phenylobacterium sp.]